MFSLSVNKIRPASTPSIFKAMPRRISYWTLQKLLYEYVNTKKGAVGVNRSL